MNKSTQNMLLIGGGIAIAYYFWKQSNPANAASVASNPTALSNSLDTNAANIINQAFQTAVGS